MINGPRVSLLVYPEGDLLDAAVALRSAGLEVTHVLSHRRTVMGWCKPEDKEKIVSLPCVMTWDDELIEQRQENSLARLA